MPYKVVQTVEKGKPVLTAVPHSWEKDGTLYWPKNQADKLIKVEDICPEDNWIPIPCELKKDNLSNYDQAHVEINSILYQGVSTGEQSNRDQNVGESSQSSGQNNRLKTEFDIEDPLIYDVQVQAPAALSAGMELILENQRVMLENQKKIMRKLNEFTEKLKKVNSGISDIQCFETSTSIPDISLAPVDDLQGLEELENKLKDPEKKNMLLKKYACVCNERGIGTNYFAYYLIDIFFTRKFLTKCSWGGGSRGEEPKIPFKTFTNVINFFHQLVYASDKTFTLMECHAFLQLNLRNSNKRLMSKMLRAPHRKRRRRRKDLKITFTDDNDGDKSDENNCLQLILSPEVSPKKGRHSDEETSDGETEGVE